MSCFESEVESPACRVFGEAAYQRGIVSLDDAEERLSGISHVGPAHYEKELQLQR